jgi:hypothetical protein
MSHLINTYMEYKFIEDHVNMWWVYTAYNGKDELRISQTLKLQLYIFKLNYQIRTEKLS